MDAHSFSFDVYQRYGAAARIVDAWRPTHPLSIVDVGGLSDIARHFFPRDRVVVLDLEPALAGAFVLGDGSRLPFRQRVFDIVLSLDVIEHLEEPSRGQFLEEIIRVARGAVILGAPFADPRVREIESEINSMWQRVLGEDNPFLEDHFNRGLPEWALVQEVAWRKNLTPLEFANGNLRIWFLMMWANCWLSEHEFFGPMREAFNRYYNRELAHHDHQLPCYRRLVCLPVAPLTKDQKERLNGLRAQIGKGHALGADQMERLLLVELERLMLHPQEGVTARLRDWEERIRQLEEGVAFRDEQIDHLKDGIEERDAYISTLKEGIAFRDEQVKGLTEGIEERDRYIGELEEGIAFRDEQVKGLTEGTEERDRYIATLKEGITFRDEQVKGLSGAVEERDRYIAMLKEGIEYRDAQIERLNREAEKLVGEGNALREEILQRDQHIEMIENASFYRLGEWAKRRMFWRKPDPPPSS